MVVVVVAGGGGSVRRARARTACKSGRCWEVMEVVEEYEVEAGNVIILVVVEVASFNADVMAIGKGTGVAGVAGVGRVKVRATQARFSLKECPRDHPPSRPQVMALGLESPMRKPYAESASPGTKRKLGASVPLNRSWWIPFLHSWMK